MSFLYQWKKIYTRVDAISVIVHFILEWICI